MVARAIVSEGVAPHAAAACAAWGPSGWISEEGGDDDLLFDLASLTKPMTAVAVARSGLARDALLSQLLPELAATASADATLELLLAHRAGLAANLPLFEPLLQARPVDPDLALAAAANARREDASGPIPEGGFAPLYSDLGYILAGAALARAAGMRDAGEAIDRWVSVPLGLQTSLGTARELEDRGVDLAGRAAPTEVVAFRGGEVRGRVHDENAWALTGRGGSGHAGMFGTVRAVRIFACAVEDALAKRASALAGDLAWLVAPRPGGTLRAGFDGKSSEGSSAGARFGSNAFGHLGFTGTSLWIDPDAEVVAVLLTNRVHPTRDNARIRAARPSSHDAMFARALELRESLSPGVR